MRFYQILAGVMSAGVLLLLFAQLSLSQQIADAKEAARPADIEIIAIVPLECELCFDASRIVQALKTQPVAITQERTIAYPSEQADELIAKHALTTLPAVIISGETSKENIASVLAPQTRASEDALVWTNTPPPYVDLKDGTTKGVVSVILLTNEACDACYDAQNHPKILTQSFGMSLANTETVDIASARGAKLRGTYGITAVPTAIVSQDAAAYPSFVNAWKSVGSVEEDGSFVFRDLAALGAYYDLTTRSVVTPQTP